MSSGIAAVLGLMNTAILSHNLQMQQAAASDKNRKGPASSSMLSVRQIPSVPQIPSVSSVPRISRISKLGID